jgi:hypothetical protein
MVVGFHAFGPKPEPESSPPGDGKEVAAPLEGSIDVLVWDRTRPGRRKLPLSDPNTPPLTGTDEIRVTAELNRPAYVYIVWISSRGDPTPIYPWDEKWRRPAAERPVSRLDLPEDEEGRGWKMDAEAPSGMETLVLLAREAPLPAEVDVRGLLTGLPPQKKLGVETVVWFENGVRVPSGRNREPLVNTLKQDSPLRQTHRRIREQLLPHFSWSRAVSFEMQGK